MASRENRGSKDWSGPKILFLAILFTLCWLGLWGRAYYIQIIQGEILGKQANRQYWASHSSRGERGEIFDRNGRLLAKSVRTHSVYAHPLEVVDRHATIRSLHKIFGTSERRLRSLINGKKKFVWIARKISDQQVAALKISNLAGIYLKEDRLRMYPQGHLAGQLLGFVGLDGDGLEGLEKSFDTILGSTDTHTVVQRDAAGRKLYTQDEDTAGQGRDIHLTLDSVVQSAAEDALAESVQKFHGKTGLCLVVEVETGDILAWAHYPFFDPNRYGVSKPKFWKNRICLDLVEPGSIFKPFVVAAALQNRITTPQSLYFCEKGTWKVARHKIRDTHSYGWLTVDKIVRYSSNIGMSKVGADLGAEALYAQLGRFGFLRPTGLPLPAESKGMIRPFQRWTSVDLAAASFGQGVALTPLQIAHAYVALGNKGKMKTLHLRIDEDTTHAEPRVVDEDVALQILTMLRGVVEKDGTGTQARIPGVSVGGKTGTAQKPDASGGYGEEFVASFVAFIPALNPRYFILAMVDEPHPQHYGGVVSAPVIRKVGAKLLAYRGESLPAAETEAKVLSGTDFVREHTEVTPRTAVGDFSTDAHVPNFCGCSLRKAVEILAAQGVVPQVSGEGFFVVRQRPRAGSDWAKSNAKTCRLWLTKERATSLCQ